MEQDWRQDAPFFAVAALLHAVVLTTNPSLPWSGAKAPERVIPVEFVSMPAQPEPLEPPVPGDGSTKAPGFGPGEFQPEKKGPAPKKIAKAVRPKADPAVAAQRRLEKQHRAMRLALARAELERARQAKIQAARDAALEAAQKKAAEKAAALAAARAAAEAKAREAAERRMARARKQADIARALAFLPSPDERVTDAPAQAANATPKGGLDGGPAGHAAAAYELGDTPEETPAYAADALRRTGKDAYSAQASGGGYGQGGGDASFTLEGPVGSRRMIHRVLPESPAWVAQRALDLAVQIRFQVLADGTVKPGAVIARTSGFPELDRRALEAIKRWKFQAQPGANPVWGMVSFRFTS